MNFRILQKFSQKKTGLILKSFIYGTNTLFFKKIKKKTAAIICEIQNEIIKIISLFYNFTIKRNKPNQDSKILVIRFQHRPGCVKKTLREISTEYYNLILTAKEVNGLKIENYFYDKNFKKYYFPFGDLNLIKKCRESNFSAILISSYNPSALGYPRPKTLEIIKNNLKIPILTLWWDSVGKDRFTKFAKKTNKFTSKHLFIDKYHSKKEFGNKTVNIGFVPQPKCLFHKPKINKDIDVCFLGSTNSYRISRLQYLSEINDLKKEKYKVLISGGTDEKRLTMKKYAAILRRSKIILNFSMGAHGQHQVKGRVTETMAVGGFLLESQNQEISKIFKKNVHYVSFRNPKDLRKKIMFYLKHAKKRKKISEAGHKYYKRKYSAKKFWDIILNEAN